MSPLSLSPCSYKDAEGGATDAWFKRQNGFCLRRGSSQLRWRARLLMPLGGSWMVGAQDKEEIE